MPKTDTPPAPRPCCRCHPDRPAAGVVGKKWMCLECVGDYLQRAQESGWGLR